MKFFGTSSHTGVRVSADKTLFRDAVMRVFVVMAMSSFFRLGFVYSSAAPGGGLVPCLYSLAHIAARVSFVSGSDNVVAQRSRSLVKKKSEPHHKTQLKINGY